MPEGGRLEILLFGLLWRLWMAAIIDKTSSYYLSLPSSSDGTVDVVEVLRGGLNMI